MKQFTYRLLAAASAFLVSCNKETVTPRDNQQNVNTMTDAVAFYYGDYYGNNLDNYILELAEGDVDEYGGIGDCGSYLALDLNTVISSNFAIASGEYLPLLVPSSSKSFTFVTGADQGDSIVGSYVYEKTSSGAVKLYIVTDGIVTVECNRRTYSITANVTAGGKEMEFVFEGTVTFVDESEEEPDKYSAVVDQLCRAELCYYGQIYGDTGTDYANWILYMGDKSIDIQTLSGTGDAIQIEFNTASTASKTVPEGRYKMMTEFKESEFKEFTVVPGYIASDYGCYGVWYFNDSQERQLQASEGWLDVSSDNSGGYTFNFSFTDASGNSVQGDYSGNVTYTDCSESTKGLSPARFRHKMLRTNAKGHGIQK